MNQQELWLNPIYAALKAAGVTVTQHADDPSIGWFFSCTAGQYGPFETPELAIEIGVKTLIRNAVIFGHAAQIAYRDNSIEQAAPVELDNQAAPIEAWEK